MAFVGNVGGVVDSSAFARVVLDQGQTLDGEALGGWYTERDGGKRGSTYIPRWSAGSTEWSVGTPHPWLVLLPASASVSTDTDSFAVKHGQRESERTVPTRQPSPHPYLHPPHTHTIIAISSHMTRPSAVLLSCRQSMAGVGKKKGCSGPAQATTVLLATPFSSKVR